MEREKLIRKLKTAGFSEKFLNAFSEVPRELFIPEKLRDFAYEDAPLPIGEGQTISQPYTIAIMLEELDLNSNHRVLEIGSGCGYVLALLSKIAKDTYGIEILEVLVKIAQKNLKNYKNISVFNKNGVEGLEEYAPFDRILISAGCQTIPPKLFEQLSENGKLVAPVGSRDIQSIVSFKKENGKILKVNEIPGFTFVPFIQ